MLSEGRLAKFFLELIEQDKERNEIILELLASFIVFLLEQGRECTRDLFDKYYSNHDLYFGREIGKSVDIDEFIKCVQELELKTIDFSKYYAHQ